MTAAIDALHISRFLNTIKTCSKEKLLSCLSSMNESNLRHLIFLSLKQSKPQIKQLIDNIWKHDTLENTAHTDHIQQFFIADHDNTETKQTETTQNNNNSLTSLPSSIGAYIISFNTMKDRINNELISKDFYKFCQIPMAKYHLIIDHKFCKALYFDTIHIEKHFNAQYIEVTYVFKDSHYEKFEEKYYSIISKILLKSPLLHTIKYKLTYKKFKSKLSQTSSGDQWYGYTGHIIEWMTAMKIKSSPQPLFRSVTKLIWTPSQYSVFRWRAQARSNHWNLFWRKQYEVFCDFLPNLTSIVVTKCRAYLRTTRTSSDDNDCVWNLFSKPFYYNTLQHIKCNMNVKSLYARPRDMYFYKHINMENHPLLHFHKFTNLKSLTLTLPIWENCKEYYTPIIWGLRSCKMFSLMTSLPCMNLTEVSLEFVRSEVRRFEGDEKNKVLNKFNVIDFLCREILSYCPNIKKYRLITNNLCNGKLGHLIGKYDRLEWFETDSLSIIHKDTRMISLKQLTLILYNNKQLESVCNDLSGFPNLESFKCIYINKLNEKRANLNGNMDDFLSYLSKQTANRKLKYIGIYHQGRQIKNERKKKIKREYFNLKACTKDNSLELCKSIIMLRSFIIVYNIKRIVMIYLLKRFLYS